MISFAICDTKSFISIIIIHIIMRTISQFNDYKSDMARAYVLKYTKASVALYPRLIVSTISFVCLYLGELILNCNNNKTTNNIVYKSECEQCYLCAKLNQARKNDERKMERDAECMSCFIALISKSFFSFDHLSHCHCRCRCHHHRSTSNKSSSSSTSRKTMNDLRIQSSVNTISRLFRHHRCMKLTLHRCIHGYLLYCFFKKIRRTERFIKSFAITPDLVSNYHVSSKSLMYLLSFFLSLHYVTRFNFLTLNFVVFGEGKKNKINHRYK